MKEHLPSTEGRAWYRALTLREELGLVWGKSYGDGGEKRVVQASILGGKQTAQRQVTRLKVTPYLRGGTRHGEPLGGQFLGANTNYTGLCELLPAGRWGDTHWRRFCAGTTLARPQAPHISFHFDTIPSKMLTFLFKKKGSSTDYSLALCHLPRGIPQTSPARSSLFLCDENDVRDSGSAIP